MAGTAMETEERVNADCSEVTPDTERLQEELAQYRQEKEKIRRLVGQIGGVASNRRDRMMNVMFMVAIGLLLIIDVLRHVLGWELPLPALFSLELGVLLVSIKIIWMIHRSTKVEHFQFWILNTIEFRLNEISKRISEIEKRLK
jgi:hypothetical protein